MDGDGRAGPVWGQEQCGRPPLHQTAVLLPERHSGLSWSLGRGQCDSSHPFILKDQFSLSLYSLTPYSLTVLQFCLHQLDCRSFLTGQRDAASASGSHVEPDWPRWSQSAPLAAHQQHPRVGRRPRPRQVGGRRSQTWLRKLRGYWIRTFQSCHMRDDGRDEMQTWPRLQEHVNSDRPCMHSRALHNHQPHYCSQQTSNIFIQTCVIIFIAIFTPDGGSVGPPVT